MRLQFLLATALLAGAAEARTLTVGEGQEYAMPSLAIAAAAPGDTVLIEPGTYFDCAIWGTDQLTVAGRAPGVVITDKTCEGKAVLVIRGTDTVVRDLTLARARVADGNGAGIRLEGQSLVLERVGFVNNQVGLLAAAAVAGELLIRDCRFEGGGVDGERPTMAVLVGVMALLRVERTVFEGMRGSQVGSAALRTELVGNRIATTRLAVSAAGASLLMEDNVLTLSPEAEGRQAAVLANADVKVVMRRNQLVNQSGRPATLLLDWTSETPVLQGNTVPPGDREVSSDGIWRHRGGTVAREVKEGVRGLFGAVKRQVFGN